MYQIAKEATYIHKHRALQKVAINKTIFVIRFGKTVRNGTTSETAFIAPYYRYIHILSIK